MEKGALITPPAKEYGGLEIVVISKPPPVAALFCLTHNNTAAETTVFLYTVGRLIKIFFQILFANSLIVLVPNIQLNFSRRYLLVLHTLQNRI